MIEIQNGQAWQWDIEKSVFVDDDINEVHFSLNNEETAKVVTPEQSEARIPDEFLQETGSIKVFAVKDNQTIETKNFPITARPKPEDYYMPPKPPKVDMYLASAFLGSYALDKLRMNVELNFVGDYEAVDEIRVCKFITTKGEGFISDEDFDQLTLGGIIDGKAVSVSTYTREKYGDGFLFELELLNFANFTYHMDVPPNTPSFANSRTYIRVEYVVDGIVCKSPYAVYFDDGGDAGYVKRSDNSKQKNISLAISNAVYSEDFQ